MNLLAIVIFCASLFSEPAIAQQLTNTSSGYDFKNASESEQVAWAMRSVSRVPGPLPDFDKATTLRKCILSKIVDLSTAFTPLSVLFRDCAYGEKELATGGEFMDASKERRMEWLLTIAGIVEAPIPTAAKVHGLERCLVAMMTPRKPAEKTTVAVFRSTPLDDLALMCVKVVDADKPSSRERRR